MYTGKYLIVNIDLILYRIRKLTLLWLFLLIKYNKLHNKKWKC